MSKCRICGHANPGGIDRCQNCGAWLEQTVPATSGDQPAESSSPPDDFESQIMSLVQQGQMIAAIKLYREHTGIGLAEAKSAVEALAAGQPIELRNPEADGIPSDSLEGRVLALVRARRKIEAIKLYREQTGLGLKEAKDAVEALAIKHGINPKGAGCAGIVLAMISIATGLILACGIAGCGHDRGGQDPVDRQSRAEPLELRMSKATNWPQIVLTNEASCRDAVPATVRTAPVPRSRATARCRPARRSSLARRW
jgi:ribosomal protein L7/L12